MEFGVTSYVLLVIYMSTTLGQDHHGQHHKHHHRHKRQTMASPLVKQYITQALIDANAELAEQKHLDLLMTQRGKTTHLLLNIICLFSC